MRSREAYAGLRQEGRAYSCHDDGRKARLDRLAAADA